MAHEAVDQAVLGFGSNEPVLEGVPKRVKLSMNTSKAQSAVRRAKRPCMTLRPGPNPSFPLVSYLWEQPFC
jgi:hypothetical protein